MVLSAEEARVVACLVEKEATVPDTYPLTLNTLRLACNQTSNRNPVVAWDDRTVEAALLSLKSMGLVRFVHPSHGGRTIRYRHAADERWRLSKGELGVLAVLVLRGPQTTGEVRTRTERMVGPDDGTVEEILDMLAARSPEPFAERVGRQPGEREGRWAQALSGEPQDGIGRGDDTEELDRLDVTGPLPAPAKAPPATADPDLARDVAELWAARRAPRAPARPERGRRRRRPLTRRDRTRLRAARSMAEQGGIRMSNGAIVGSACGDPLALDAAWMGEALESAGVADGATVTDLEFDGFIGTGQMSRNARYRLTWDDPDGRPATVVGKFPSSDANTRQSSFDSGAYHHEFAFYAQLAATVDITTPRCWVARFDADDPDFVLIMEDLADSRQGDQFTEPDDEVSARAIEQAAALHGPRWGDPTLADEPALRSPFGDRGELLRHYFTAASDVCLTRLGHGLEDDVQQLIRDFIPLVGAWAQGTGTPTTPVHGDFRPDNFLIGQTPEAVPFAVVDWQTLALGLGVADVAYFIGGAFEPARRAAIEDDLLARYRDELGRYGPRYDPADCWRDYVWGTLHGVVIAVCATMMADQTERGDAMLTLMARRHARHAIDLGALDRVRSATRA